jgi:type III pantothenate kinase
MLLAVDIGNTHTVIGCFQGEALILHWRIQTDRGATADEIASILHGLFSRASRHFTDLTGIVVASVVPQLNGVWTNFGRSVGIEPLLVDPNLDTGIPIRLDHPGEVGADRIVNAVAAYRTWPGPLVIVDFGTATTFDCVSSDGAYIGGAIAPGLALSLDALGQKTAKLPRVDITIPPRRAIGTNTVDAIRSGLLFGYGGLVEGILAAIVKEFPGARPRIIATGGLAGLVAPHAPSIERVEPHLTLEGLRILHERLAR